MQQFEGERFPYVGPPQGPFQIVSNSHLSTIYGGFPRSSGCVRALTHTRKNARARQRADAFRRARQYGWLQRKALREQHTGTGLPRGSRGALFEHHRGALRERGCAAKAACIHEPWGSIGKGDEVPFVSPLIRHCQLDG